MGKQLRRAPPAPPHVRKPRAKAPAAPAARDNSAALEALREQAPTAPDPSPLLDVGKDTVAAQVEGTDALGTAGLRVAKDAGFEDAVHDWHATRDEREGAAAAGAVTLDATVQSVEDVANGGPVAARSAGEQGADAAEEAREAAERAAEEARRKAEEERRKAEEERRRLEEQASQTGNAVVGAVTSLF